tara:strand:+ start:1206 stop:1664 length:459 start_codon:yes stop_codon:yes gene_type:complete
MNKALKEKIFQQERSLEMLKAIEKHLPKEDVVYIGAYVDILNPGAPESEHRYANMLTVKIGSKSAIKEVIRTFPKMFKEYRGVEFTVEAQIKTDSGLVFDAHFYMNRNLVCERKVTGQVWEDGRAATKGEMVDVVEWVCNDSILKETTIDEG